MPSLDFSDVLSSPEFVDTIAVISTARTISAGGVGVDIASDPVAKFAIVIPDPASLVRQSDGTRLSAALTLYTAFRLSGGIKADDAHATLPDIVVWHGRRYVVSGSEDYGAFGAGFWKSSADLLDFNPAV